MPWQFPDGEGQVRAALGTPQTFIAHGSGGRDVADSRATDSVSAGGWLLRVQVATFLLGLLHRHAVLHCRSPGCPGHGRQRAGPGHPDPLAPLRLARWVQRLWPIPSVAHKRQLLIVTTQRLIHQHPVSTILQGSFCADMSAALST